VVHRIKTINLDACKEFDEEIILEASIVISVRLQQYTMIIYVEH
jgi:hypothetical protein